MSRLSFTQTLTSLVVSAFLVSVSFGVMSAQSDGTAVPSKAERVELPNDAGEALVWKAGPKAVLLAHGAVYDAASWTDQAEAMQLAGYSVLSVEDISADAILAAKTWLLEEQGATGVVVIGASAGGGGALSALAEDSSDVVGLVLLGATGSVDQIGDFPKLFTASEGEGITDRLETMAEEASGDSNQVEIIPGSAHAQATFKNPEGEQLLDAILQFLDEDAAWPEESGTPES